MAGLFSSLSSQRMLEQFRAPHLRQLVTRLDYNEWWVRQRRRELRRGLGGAG